MLLVQMETGAIYLSVDNSANARRRLIAQMSPKDGGCCYHVSSVVATMCHRFFFVLPIIGIIAAALLAACSGQGLAPQFPTSKAVESSAVRSLQPSNAPQYTIIVLPDLGGNVDSANGVNDRGDAAGYAALPGFPGSTAHAVLWRKGVLTDLRTLGGSITFWPESHQINNNDLVVGTSETTVPDPNGESQCGNTAHECRVFLWQRGTIAALPTLGGNNAYDAGINNIGQVSGTSETSVLLPCPSFIFLYVFKAFVWEKGHIAALPLFPGDNVATAGGMNDHGQVVGTSGEVFGTANSCSTIARHAVLWQDGRVTDLGTLGGTDGNLPSYINNRGEIVGESDIAGDIHHHAFLWRRGTILNLGTLPGDVDSSASRINDNGLIAGFSFDVNGNARAVLWSHGVIYDLNTLVPSNAGIFLQEALDINNRGQISGFGCRKCDGSDALPFLATPTGKIGSVNAGSGVSRGSAVVTQSAQNAWKRFLHRTR